MGDLLVQSPTTDVPEVMQTRYMDNACMALAKVTQTHTHTHTHTHTRSLHWLLRCCIE